MWDTVELRELRIFLTLAEELHFAHTAERLHLSQSRVSQAIRTLETRVGGQLFERTSRRVVLTALGKQMQSEIAPAYEQLRQAYEQTREQARGVAGTLRIGLYTPMSAGPRMIDIVALFTTRNPACEVVFVNTGLDEDPLSWVRTGRVDLLAVRLPIVRDDIAIGPILSEEPRVLLISRNDPLAAEADIAYDDIGDRPVSDLPNFPREMMDAYIPPLTSSGRRLHRIISTTTDEAMMRVATGEQVHPTVPSWLDHHAHPGVVAVPIRDLPPSQTALAWVATLQSPRIEAFIAAAHQTLTQP